MKVHTLILAGGLGSRLGYVRKADLRVGGTGLIQRVIERLGPEAGTILLSSGRGPDLSRWGINLPDLDLALAGPMAGLIAAVRHLHGQAGPEDVLLSVAVDTPFLPRDFRDRLLAGLDQDHQAAYACYGTTCYPTNAIWRLSALADLPQQARTARAPHSPRRLLELLKAAAIDWPEAREDPFANLNTLADVVTLGERAISRGE